jgi:hypothetical protein
MSRPSPIISKITVPNSVFPGLALTHKDFRLNFCLNCGSKSSPDEVPIFNADDLDGQLDDVTFLAMEDSLEVDTLRRVVLLPKVCSWYLSDFCPRKIGSPSPIDCVRVLAHYTKGETKHALSKLLTETGGSLPAIKFKPYSYRCRSFFESRPRAGSASTAASAAAAVAAIQSRNQTGTPRSRNSSVTAGDREAIATS